MKSFRSIFSHIQNKPYQKEYPKNACFYDFDASSLTYPQESESSDLQLNDFPEYARIENAKEKIHALCNDPEQKSDKDRPFLLVSGDLSGIQDTVYTISAKGALKSLRARSFLLELLCEHCCFELISACLGDYGEYRNHVIFSGGGGFCLLLPNSDGNEEFIKNLKIAINDWAFEEFSGRLYLAIASVALTVNEAGCGDDNQCFREKWQDLSDFLEKEKKRKFSWRLDEIFSETKVIEPSLRTNSQECQICHRDDIDCEQMFILDSDKKHHFANKEEFLKKAEDTDLVIVHELCYRLFKLGGRSKQWNYILRSNTVPDEPGYISFPSLTEEDGAFYCIGETLHITSTQSFIWEINPLKSQMQEQQFLPFYLANYIRMNRDLPSDVLTETFEREKQKYADPNYNKFITRTADFENLAKSACGADLIGCLRMDVDNMGKIFSHDLTIFNLVTLANLSNMLNIFFKVYLTQICNKKNEHNTIYASNFPQPFKPKDEKANSNGRNVSIIYSGGDDLFIIGAWNEAGELAYDIQKCFAKFSGLGISATLTVHKPRFPLYQIAKLGETGLKEAKSFKYYDEDEPPKNRFSLFYSTFSKLHSEALEKQAMANINNDENSDFHNKLVYAFEWNDTFQFRIIENIFKLAEVKNNRLVLKDIPHSLIYKLFSIIEVWWKRNVMYIPELTYILEKIAKDKSQDSNKKAIIHELLNLIISFPACTNTHKVISSLKPALTWIELMQRNKD